ncbi:hypothetical protein VKT23_016597 [Stygiomarasmius scandens]|uniref:Uncharacterized protein n=1 Tax=Marasmiellus scandens TaxID=2682957 RepID=A0ABR1IWM1_9AGAR
MQQHRIDLAAATYQDAWKAKLGLVDGNRAEVGWEILMNDDVCCMEDLDEALRKERAAARRKGRLPLEGAGESCRLISWIWETSRRGVNGSTEKVLFDGLRVEWCKAYARVHRYREELLLLKEEMRRCLVSLDWEARQWAARANILTEGAHAEGVSAYAHQQAALQRRIAERFKLMWAPINISVSSTLPSSSSLDFGNVNELQPLPEADQSQSTYEDNDEDEDEDDWEDEAAEEAEQEIDEDAEQEEEETPLS